MGFDVLTWNFLLASGFVGQTLHGVVVLTWNLLLAPGFVGQTLYGVVVVFGEQDAEGAVRQSQHLRDVELDSLLLEVKRADPASATQNVTSSIAPAAPNQSDVARYPGGQGWLAQETEAWSERGGVLRMAGTGRQTY